MLLDAGDNVHTASLCSLLGRVTTAAEVLEIIRREQPGCVNVLNAGVLALEDDAGRHGRLTERGEIR